MPYNSLIRNMIVTKFLTKDLGKHLMFYLMFSKAIQMIQFILFNLFILKLWVFEVKSFSYIWSIFDFLLIFLLTGLVLFGN